jgi:hypothetical protein
VQEETSVRLAAAPRDREPRASADPGSIFQMMMTWTVGRADQDGEWSWGAREWGATAWNDIILPKLTDWQRLRWREIDTFATPEGHKSHHNMSISSICNEAQDRLVELEQIEDDIFRFRLGNRRRLWGFRIVSEFQILWYDPLHQVYPTEPD